MQLLLKLLARLGLVLTILPSILFLFEGLDLSTVKVTMIIGTVFWLAAAPFVQKIREDQPTVTEGNNPL